jgi:nicotinamide-nucleotide amidase
MNAAVLSIGNEVLSGRTLDTNFQFLARLLEEHGAKLVAHETVPDERAAIGEALRLALARADLVVTTGGLGPTADDLTVEAIAAFFGLPVALDEAVLDSIRKRWALWARGPMPESNARQAMLPRGAEAWPNPVGSAPGVHIAKDGKDVVLLPGVPEEMAALARDFVAPLVRERSGVAIEYVVVRTVGIAESILEDRLRGLAELAPGLGVAFLPGGGAVDLRIALPAELGAEARAALADRVRAFARERAGEYVYAEDDRGLEHVVGELLAARKLQLSVAESCTGGLLGGRITSVPGSSAWFAGGAIVYANDAKSDLAGVPAELIEKHGAVSEEVARALASGVAKRFGVACGLGVTGIAGPDGGTADKPVGTVHVAAVAPAGVYHRHLRLRGNRAQIRERSVTAALELLRRLLLGLPATSAQSLGVPPKGRD